MTGTCLGPARAWLVLFTSTRFCSTFMMDSLHTLKNAHESAEFDSDAEAELLTRTTTPYSRNPSGPPSPQAGTSTAASTPPPGALSDIDGPSCATSARVRSISFKTICCSYRSQDTDEEKDDETENGDLNATLPLTVDELVIPMPLLYDSA